MPSVATDLPSLGAQPYQVAPPRTTYPFSQNGDYSSTLLVRTLKQLAAFYSPGRVGIDTDFVNGGDPNMYQALPDSDPVFAPFGGTVTFTRTYARIPAQQTTYGSRMIDRPVMHDITAGGYYAVSFDNGVTSHVFSARLTASLSGTPDVPNSAPGNTPGALGHVLISVTLNNSAQTFYADDDDATIWAALSSAVSGNPATYASNAYFPILRTAGKMVIGNATVSCTLKALSCTDSLTALSVGSGRLLGTGAAGVDLMEIESAVANADSIRTISSTSHGGSAGDLVALWNGAKLISIGKVVSATTDAFTVQLETAPGANDVVTHAQFADTSSTRYVNGPAMCSVKEVTDFYLPLVSTGITTPADITLVAPKLDPVSWLTAIQAGTAYVVCEGSQLERWLGGPIYAQTTISVQMSDALDTVAVGA